MKKCLCCGLQVSIWQRDLFSGICRKCRAQEAAEQERLRQEEEAARQQAIDEQGRAEQDRVRREKEAVLQKELGQQLAKQQQHSESLPTCSDCGAALVEIKLFGRGTKNPLSGAAVDTAVVFYTDADASPSWGFGMLKEKGKVRAAICTSCHRIFFHGVPLESF